MRDTTMSTRAALALTILALTGLGSSCPGGAIRTSFRATNNLSSTTASIFPRSWQSPMFIDHGAIDAASTALSRNQNIVTGAADSPSNWPMAVLNDAASSFYAVFNRANTAPSVAPTQARATVTQQTDFSSTGWVSGYNSFITLDVGTGTWGTGLDSQRPLAAVDSNGNAITVLLATDAGTKRRPIASRHAYGDGSWTYPFNISYDTETGNVTEAAIGVDANNNVTVVWQQNSKMYFNEYRPSLGWRFKPSVAPNYGRWHATLITPSASNYGTDVGFDAAGNGYGIYIGSAGDAITARWRYDKPQHFSTDTGDFKTISGSGTARYPRLAVAQDGVATAFFVDNVSLDGKSAELWSAQTTTPATACSSSGLYTCTGSASFATATRFDTDTGSSASGILIEERTGSGRVPFIVAHAGTGSAIVLGFIKPDATGLDRFYVFRYNVSSRTWTSLGAIDEGGTAQPVSWGDLAVNSAGEIAAVFSATGSDGYEHVYGNYYNGTDWQGASQLDQSNLFTDSTPLYRTRPAVSVDSDGNAVAVFSILDNIFSPPTRRAVAVEYR